MNTLPDEERKAHFEKWRQERAEEDRKREEAIRYENDFCDRFGIKHEECALIRVRAEKKCRAIIEYLGLAPTEEDLKTGKVFLTKREEYVIASAFVSTKQGGLIGCIEINRRDVTNETYAGWENRYTNSAFRDWIWRERYKHHKTAEEIAYEEESKRRCAESAEREAEWERKNRELRSAEYRELQAQVKHTALPDALVDQLVSLAVKETDEQRENSPDRRPTFAPPIAFSKELIAALERVKALNPKIEFESGYGRLWATWESPKKAHGKCQGFELRAGKAHDGEVIVKIRPGVGHWWTGPDWQVPSLYLKSWMVGNSQGDAQHKAYNQKKDRFLLCSELRELGISEILKFAGAPEEVMLAGARLAGICCKCGRSLTDPTSMALGIGPECIKSAIWWAQRMNGWTKEQTEAYYLARQEKQTALL